MDNRNYILDRITSKKTSIEEFNFDKLEAPPLSWFFSPFDILELNNIARSIKYSAKPQARYDAIDKICRKRGLVKFAAGTNRVVYKHPEFPDILFKIAADDIGLGDNPAEFKNQFVLKPFVAKTFEISPCGTIAIVEKCNPIQSREEFISIADDIFEMITEWLVGRYVLADIGSKFFMNWSTRKSFGPVLIDYPYCYEIDGNKLYCNRPDINSISGTCDGEIDYDDGFNFLVCTKCGRRFKAKELEKKIKDNELIVERQGEQKMKITARGGSKAVNRNIETETIGNDNFLSVKVSTPVSTNIGDAIDKAVPKAKKVVLTGSTEELVSEGLVVKKIADVVDNKEVPITKEDKVELPPVTKSVNGVSTNKTQVVESPITISEEVKTKALENKKDDAVKNPVEIIDSAVDTILDNFDNIKIDEVRDDSIVRVFDALAGKLPANKESIIRVTRLLNELIDNVDDDEYTEAVSCDELLTIAKTVFSTDVRLTNAVRDNDDLDVTFVTDIYHGWDTIDEADPVFTTAEETITISNVYAGVDEEAESDDDSDVSDSENDSCTGVITTNYSGMTFYSSKIVDIKDIFPGEEQQEVILLIDENENYLAIDGNIIAIDYIDDQFVQNVTPISKVWLEEVNAYLTNESDSNEEDTRETLVSEEKVTESAPVGALPPVEEVSYEEGSNNEEE